MESTLSPGGTSAGIWGRVVKPDQGDLSLEAARAILDLKFNAEDLRRMDELSERAQRGELTPVERAEIEEYLRVTSELAVLQSKARLSLKRVTSTP